MTALFVVIGCDRNKDPEDPLPDPIRSYFILYNFFTESHDIKWEINNSLVESSHGYGIPVTGYTTLNSTSQNVEISAMVSGESTLIESQSYSMSGDNFYIIALLGSANNPYILFEPIDLDPPPPGEVRMRFLQAVSGLSAVDVYIGGTLPEFKRISAITFSDITPYVNVSVDEAWESLTVTPYNVNPDPATNILSFSDNEVFAPDIVYLCVIAHIQNDPSSSVELILYEQPINP